MPFPCLARLFRLLCLLLAVPASFADGLGAAKVRPSDCKPRNADSTCATAVPGATVAAPAQATPDTVLYDGPIAGVPATGYAYWGFDFIADQSGTPSPVRQDEFVNRSGVPVTIRFTFDIPTDHACNKDCLPGVQFQVDAGWHKVDPPFVVDGNSVSRSSTFAPGQGYGWLIALWASTNPRLTVSVPKGSTATLTDVGLSKTPAIATEIPRSVGTCDCPDGSRAACSAGSRFSNGLLGPWFQNADMYQRSGAFTDCAFDR